MRRLLSELDTTNSEGELNVIVETPSRSRNKFKYNPDSGVIELSKILPLGAVFPYEFGFIPSTLGEDGDPLDILLLVDEPAYPGVLVTARLIGVIEAEQTEDGKTERNDRLIAVATASLEYQHVTALSQLDAEIVTHIEHFFISYNQMENREFEPVGRADSSVAAKLVAQGKKRFDSKSKEARRKS